MPKNLQHVNTEQPSTRYVGQVIEIRWPIAVDKSARDNFVESARRNFYSIHGFHAQEKYLDAVPEFTFAASTYSAAELYQAVLRKMPGAAVLLEPVVLRDQGGAVVETPQVDDDIPADFIIEVVDRQFPEFPFMNTYLSYTVRTAPSASPGNCGLLVAMEEEVKKSEVFSREMTCRGSLADMAPNPIWYFGFADEDVGTPPKVQSALPLRTDSVVVFPPVSLSSAGMFGVSQPEYVKTSRPSSPGDVSQMMLHPHLLNLASVVATAPSTLGTSPIPVNGPRLARYVRSFDAPLADSIEKGERLSPTQLHNEEVIKKLLATEILLRATRDEQLSNWILAGKYGKNFRAVRDKSYSGFNSMMASSWLSALAVTAAGAAAPPTTPLGTLQQNMSMLNQHAANMDTVGKGLYEQFIPSLDAMDAEYVEFEGTRVSLAKGSQQDLRRSLKAIYAKYKQ
ncbi:hypothetical protein [Caballeronia calidae]|nr:hypothetical protein [Caballeronia calidae]